MGRSYFHNLLLRDKSNLLKFLLDFRGKFNNSAKQSNMNEKSSKVSIISDFAHLDDRAWSAVLSGWSVKVLIIGCDNTLNEWLRGSLKSINIRSVALDPANINLSTVVPMARSFTHLIVNIDSYPNLADAIHTLLALREQSTTVIIIVVSVKLIDDDFGMERISVCDVALRLPLTELRLRKSLLIARENRLKAQKDCCT